MGMWLAVSTAHCPNSINKNCAIEKISWRYSIWIYYSKRVLTRMDFSLFLFFVVILLQFSDRMCVCVQFWPQPSHILWRCGQWTWKMRRIWDARSLLTFCVNPKDGFDDTVARTFLCQRRHTDRFHRRSEPWYLHASACLALTRWTRWRTVNTLLEISQRSNRGDNDRIFGVSLNWCRAFFVSFHFSRHRRSS